MDKYADRSADMQDLEILDILTPATKQLVWNLDYETYAHCRRLSLQATMAGKFLQLSSQESRLLVLGAYFHDIGKTYISHSILHKPAKLTSEEWEIMKSHPAIDNSVLGFPPELEVIIPMIQYHHERWDGSGYPYGLAKEEIPYLAMIVQLLDIYDALTHKRSYKRAFSREDAISIMQEEATRGWYQPSLIKEIVAFFIFGNSIAIA
jgi:putative two-component system response regulator